MKRYFSVAVVISCIASLCWIAIAWEKDQPSASESRAAAAEDGTKGLIVHEWGTFTSFSGSDGMRLEFRPLLDSDLPSYVIDRASHAGDNLSKQNYRALVRMETPVTYFYTDKPRSVRARVRFPEGLLTEFYPPVESISPEYGRDEVELRDTTLDWGEIHLIPMSFVEKPTEQLMPLLQGRSLQELLPKSANDLVEEHYSYARETDSALVHVHRQMVFSPARDYFEKFLFYRGLGNFRLPLEVQSLTENRFTVSNQGTDDLSWFMVLNVNEETIRFATFDGVSAGQQREVGLSDATAVPAALESAVEQALVTEGLYQAEARAMIKTWRSSWFSEQGTRVLYMVPSRIVDEMLPLEITPRPEKTVRVLVGRLDLMTPEQEASAIAIVQRSAAARARLMRENKGKELPEQYRLPEELTQLGRFAEPALARVHAVAKDAVVQSEAARLLDQLKQEQRPDLGVLGL